MKTSFYKPTHKGLQPIRVLKHNIAHRLVNRSEDLILELHLDKRLAKHINYHSKDTALVDYQMPYIDSDGVINIHETFLSYIWIVSYTIFILYEEGIAIPDKISKGLTPHKSQSPELIDLTLELFDYGKSLITSYSTWDKDYFPNPEYYDPKTTEGWYVERTNDIYVETLNFILFHEIAHAEYMHVNQVVEGKLTSQERKKLELEADSRAIELIFKQTRSDVATEVSVLIGFAAMIFLKNTVDGGPKHPDVDVRINNYLSHIKPKEDNVIWGMLVVFLKLWDKQFQHNFVHKKIYNDFREMYYELASQIK